MDESITSSPMQITYSGVEIKNINVSLKEAIITISFCKIKDHQLNSDSLMLSFRFAIIFLTWLMLFFMVYLRA